MLQADYRFGVGELWLLRRLASFEELLLCIYFVGCVIIFFIIELYKFFLVLLEVAPRGWEVTSCECALAVGFNSVLVLVAFVRLRLLNKIGLIVNYLSSEFHTCVLHPTSPKAMIALS